jgi:replicative DNA helicase
MEILDRVPPHNLEAEQAVLGALLLAPDTFAVVSEILWPESCDGEGHRELYITLKEMAEAGRPIDLVTVTEELQHREILDKVGGATYLAALAGAVPTAVNAGYYAGIVAEKGLLRSLINSCTQLAAQGYEDGVESEVLLDDAERMILALSQKRISRSYRSIRELLVETLEKIEQLYQKKGGVTGFPTGFEDIDKYTSINGASSWKGPPIVDLTCCKAIRAAEVFPTPGGP